MNILISSRESVNSNNVAIPTNHWYSRIVSIINHNLCGIITVTFPIVAQVTATLGQVTSIITRNHVQLNNVFSGRFSWIRGYIRNEYGMRISHYINEVTGWVVNNPDQNPFIRNVIVAPILEEILFRFPLLILNLAAIFFGENNYWLVSMDIMGAQINLLQSLWVVVSSIIFVYAHYETPNPYQATLFLFSALVFSFLVLRQDGGCLYAVMTHMLYNFLLTRPQQLRFTILTLYIVYLIYSYSVPTMLSI